jgi:uncharacterized protein YdeI (YjbR/CyaY-like superfamily)
MGKKDPRIDTYIAEAGEFGPLLTHLRKLIHQACPEITETIKWRSPFFLHQGIVCNMAAFKAHCSFGFWRWREIFIDDPKMAETFKMGMGNFGRLTKRADLPSDAEIISMVKTAAALNEKPAKGPRVPKSAPKPVLVPKVLQEALAKKPKAKAVFDGFSNTNRREYADWIAEAKTDETRDRRLATTIAQLLEGRTRHWKYQHC